VDNIFTFYVDIRRLEHPKPRWFCGISDSQVSLSEDRSKIDLIQRSEWLGIYALSKNIFELAHEPNES
jgi:hypothetical protein